jgi:hypothetical protein
VKNLVQEITQVIRDIHGEKLEFAVLAAFCAYSGMLLGFYAHFIAPFNLEKFLPSFISMALAFVFLGAEIVRWVIERRHENGHTH